MRKLMLLLVVLALGLFTLRANADSSTPFLEGPDSKAGAVSEGRGYLLADEGDDGPAFLVLVTTDTGETITILAKAEKGLVPAALIGRPVMIRAEVVKAPARSGHGEGAELKILSVADARKRKA